MAGGGGEGGWLCTTARASSDVSQSYRSMYRECTVYDWKRISILDFSVFKQIVNFSVVGVP